MIKLHARVTKEIEITEEQAERLKNYIDGRLEHNSIEDILAEFRSGVDNGGWDFGYIPSAWIENDLGVASEDIDL